MSCKFIWFNLPNKIKEVIAPYKEQLSEEANNVTWFNLPNKLNKIYEELSDIKTCIGIEPSKFIWYNLPNKLKALCELVECEEEPTYNFDMTSTDWGTIVDADSFKTHIENESGETGVVVEDFSLESGRLQCNISNCLYLYLLELNITDVNICSIEGLESLSLSDNQIVTFNPTIALPDSLIILGLSYNQMTLAGYTASEVWANAQLAFTNPCNVSFRLNIDSITGTTLETILISKGCIIIP